MPTVTDAPVATPTVTVGGTAVWAYNLAVVYDATIAYDGTVVSSPSVTVA